jgi:4-hydroxybutyrate CoA-transferase
LPLTLLEALHAAEDRFEGLHIYCSLVLEPIDVLNADPSHIRLVSLQPTAATAPLVARGDADYLPLRLSVIPDAFRPDGRLPLAAAMVQVSPPDTRGYCSLGVSVCMAGPVLRHAPLVIAEINPRMPRTFGAGTVHVSQIDYAVEVDHALTPLLPARVGDVEHRIGGNVAGLVPDGATIQIGIGAAPQAILEALSNHRDLGIHSGMLCDGMVPLVERGVITGLRKSLDAGQLAAGEVLGTQVLFDFVDDNPSVLMLPASKSHGLEYLRHQANFVSINSALEVDLTGQVNAEWLDGRQVSGLGGSFDFTEATMYSPGGIGIIAMSATAAGGKVSRIVSRLAAGTAVTTPRHCIQYVVTEHGVADLRDKTLRERAEALIAIAEPRFRADLEAASD